MIAFHKGLSATGGSDAVGRVATAAVVSALAAVTVVNAVVTGPAVDDQVMISLGGYELTVALQESEMKADE